MNLIEQLGGYERAKIKRDDINHTLENCEFLGGGDAREGLYERLESIEQALLEYRRQHNKYEVDDLVVFSNEKLMKPVLLKIKEFRHFNLVRLEVLDSGLCGPSYQTDIRHATDAEIEAGKRLEVV